MQASSASASGPSHGDPVWRRFDAADLARGIALAAMALYHMVWDLGFLQLTASNLALAPPGKAAARMIAGSFLALVGIGLVLAHRRGMRWRPYLRRLATIAAAAGLITAATYAAFPESYIFFGILHAIALSSVLALPFLRAPLIVVAIAAAGALVAPLVLTSALFDRPALAWTGLGTEAPVTNDYVPIFPWFGMVLVGMIAARLAGPQLRDAAVARWRATNPLSRALTWAGRHSLAIYLLHQPLLLGTLYPVSLVLGPNPEAEAAALVGAYETACGKAGGTAERCRGAAACFVDRLKAEELWAGALSGALPPDARERAQRLSRECFRAGPGGP